MICSQPLATWTSPRPGWGWGIIWDLSPSPAQVRTSCSLLRDAYPTLECWGPWEDSRLERVGLSENDQLYLRNRKGKEFREMSDPRTTVCTPIPTAPQAQALADRSATSIPAPGQGCVEGTRCHRGATVVHTHKSGSPTAVSSTSWSNSHPLHLWTTSFTLAHSCLGPGYIPEMSSLISTSLPSFTSRPLALLAAWPCPLTSCIPAHPPPAMASP